MRMKLGLVKKIAAALALAVCAGWAAEVKPLKFNEVPEADQQSYWDYLVRYKMFGAHGIIFKGQKISIPDSSGWFGTSQGDFDMYDANVRHHVGGPILIGGDIRFSNGGDSLAQGPVRVLGDVLVEHEGWKDHTNSPGDEMQNVIRGAQCVKGSADVKYEAAVPPENRFFAAAYENCPSQVPEVKEDLPSPDFDYGWFVDNYGGELHSSLAPNNEIAYIDVPPIPETAKTNLDSIYDYFIEKISFTNNAELQVRMPLNGRLTRIFSRDGFSFGGHPKIRVVYMSADAVYDYSQGKWVSGTGTNIENKEYGGNLLFYTQEDIAFPAINKEDSIQGTFISLKTISIQQHMTLAGQLLADVITINSDFDGSGFLYVPFDSPKVDPEIIAKTTFIENSVDSEQGKIAQVVPVKLSKNTDVKVTFKYCFDLSSEDPDSWPSNTKDMWANPNDFLGAMPLCNLKEYETVVIEGGTAEPTTATQIKIYAKLDGIIEGTEKVRINIYDIVGAVWYDGSRSGTFTFDLLDKDIKPSADNGSFTLVMKEDTLHSFNGPYYDKDDNEISFAEYIQFKTELSEGSFGGIVITTLPEKGSLTYFGDAVTINKNVPADSLKELVYQPAENEYGNPDDGYEYAHIGYHVVDNVRMESADEYKITVVVNSVNDAPIAENTEFTIEENSVSTVVADGAIKPTDVDVLDKFTYEFDATDDNYDKVSKLYVISADENGNGVISPKDGAVLNYESADSVLTIKVIVTDDAATTGGVGKKSTTITATLKVIDVNEAPVVENQEFAVDENSKGGDTVHTVPATTKNDGYFIASDPDRSEVPFGTLTYSIVENSDADTTNDVPFEIDANTGLITVAEGAKLDYEETSSFSFKVRVTDGGDLYSEAVVTVNLNDVNEPPVLVDDGKDKNPVNEYISGVTVLDDFMKVEVIRLKFVDPDADDVDISHFEATFTDNNKVVGRPSAEDLFQAKVVKDDDGSFYVVVVPKDSVRIDFEKIYDENQDSTYSITVKLKNIVDKDLSNVVSLDKKIAVVDQNEAPEFEKPVKMEIGEHRKNGDVIGTVNAVDLDVKNVEFRHLEYSIITPKMPMEMDSNKVVVKDASQFNYEVKPTFVFDVEVKNCVKNPSTGKYDYGCLSDTVQVTLNLTDENDEPKIIPDTRCAEGDPDCCDENDPKCKKCDDTIQDCEKPEDPPKPECVTNCGYLVKDTVYVNIRENSPAGTVILEYLVQDEDKGDVAKLIPDFETLDKSGADSLFAVALEKRGDDYKIVLKVAEGANLDYETVKELHKLMITVTDPTGLKDSVYRVIKVVDVNEAPVIVKQNFDIDEHSKVGSEVGQIEWGDDLDTKEPSFRDNKVVVIGGDTAKFAVDATGLITAKVPFDYETQDTVYKLIVKVVDRNDPTLFVVDTMTIKVNNIPEVPQITSTEFKIPENPKKKDVIGTLASEDLDDPKNVEKRVYTLVDSSDCVTVTENGTLKVKDSTKFNFETTEEVKIKVRVTDPTGMYSDTTVIVKITDVNEPPTVKDQVITVPEDAKINTVIDTVEAKDPDTKTKEYNTLTYTVLGGDTAVFKVNKKTGEVVLKDSLDYEKKKEYELIVRVTDGEFSDTAKVTIKVQNVEENSVVNITKVCDSDSCRTKPDSVFTHYPDVTICWDEGREVCGKSKCTVLSKEVCQDTTLDDGVHTIIKTYKDPTTDVPGVDTVVVFVSKSAPIVTVSANGDTLDNPNIFTIEETLSEKDSSIYVNKTKNDIRVTVKDPVTKKDSSFVVKLELDTMKVGKKDLETVSSIVDKGSVSLNLNPTGGVTRTPVNGSEIKVSYTEKVNGKKVTVTYVTDNDGDIVKTPVYDEKGRVDSIEVITVSYETTLGGKKVTVSYQADAITGQPLNVAADGRLTTADKLVIAGSSSSTKPASSSSGGKPGSSSSSKKPGSSSSAKPGASENAVQNVGAYTITYEYVDEKGNSVVVTYAIDEKGNIVKNGEGDMGYTVSYTYVNKFGNSATQSVFIVLDQVGPKVEIIAPTALQVIRSNYVEVTWTVNGVVQDTLTLQGLEKGAQWIKRYYRDKAGNSAMDSVMVIMKAGKDVDLSVEQPVVEMSTDKVEEYYAVNPPKDGEKVAISVRNPSTGKEVETLIAGSFGTEKGSYDTPYPGVEGGNHLGPTLAMEIRLPTVNDVGGLATLDDLIGSDGLVSLDGVDAKNAEKVSVEEYVDTYCMDGFKLEGDYSRINLYKSKMIVQVWIYTTLGNFVDYYTFKQDLNDPDYTNEAGMLEMYMELKPDRDGEVRTEDGHVLATGAYLYKVDAKIRAELQCTLPPVKDTKVTAKKKGDIIKKSDEMLKSFGYKRPNQK